MSINIYNEHFELIELCDKPALFTNGKIDRKTVPEGLYAYDVRHGDDGEFATVEPYAGVNHAGTIIMSEPLNFGEGAQNNGDKYINIDDGLNYLGESKSLDDFILDVNTKRGYIFAVCDDSDYYIPNALHIQRYDSRIPQLYQNDKEAAKAAEKNGVKMIYDMSGVDDGVYIDSQKNRELIEKYLNAKSIEEAIKSKKLILKTVPENEKGLFFRSEMIEHEMGAVGYLRGDFGRNGNEFWTTWFDQCSELKTQEFKYELGAMIN